MIAQKDVDRMKKALRPSTIMQIARNEMPPCFEASRLSFVAMAQLLVEERAGIKNVNFSEMVRLFGDNFSQEKQ